MTVNTTAEDRRVSDLDRGVRRGNMQTLSLGLAWLGRVKLSAQAVVIGALGLAFGSAQVAQADFDSVSALAIDSSTPSTLYAGTRGDGVFQSTNGGDSWSPVNTGLSSVHVNALAIDPITPSTLYAGTENVGTGGVGVFRSTNSGGSWSMVNTGRGLVAPSVPT
jgi:hypothetical protein